MMSIEIETLARITWIGVGATAILDAWNFVQRRFGVPTLNFAMLGRWIGGMRKGQWLHVAIAKAPPVIGESAIGWAAHYAIGIAFAIILVAALGVSWLESPTPTPAILIGMATVAAPLFVMQPAMGSGFVSSKTATPLRNCAKSFVNHTVFGVGMYLAALLAAQMV